MQHQVNYEKEIDNEDGVSILHKIDSLFQEMNQIQLESMPVMLIDKQPVEDEESDKPINNQPTQELTPMINQSLDTSIQEIFNLEEKYMNQVTRIVATQELTENIKPTP